MDDLNKLFPNASTGWKRLPKARIDPRDLLYRARHTQQLVSRPGMVIQMATCGRILDQASTEACTGFMADSIDEQLRIESGRPYNMSPLYVYYWARAYEGWENKDNGAYIFDAIKALNKFGSCPEKLHPFSIGVFQKPSLWAQSFAQLLHIKKREYLKITDQNMDGSFVDDVQDAISRGYKIGGGIDLFDGFWNKRSGIVPNPDTKDTLRGGHALHWVGYICLETEDYQRALNGEIGFYGVFDKGTITPRPQGFFVFKNSWGVQDGMNGYALVSFDYVDEHGDDFWAVRDL